MRLYDDRPSGTITRARQLRREASEPERRLLRALREAFPHQKWRHQVPVGPYYADILCLSEKLVIEVDGDTHAESASQDERRTRLIAREGYRVLRVLNHDVMNNPEGVLTHISLSLPEREGAPQARKGESGQAKERASRPSPAHPHLPMLRMGPFLSHWERRSRCHPASSNMSCAFCAVAESRSLSSSTPATRPTGR